ncbi:unnamed protein product, partial [Ixodes pacificus]
LPINDQTLYVNGSVDAVNRWHDEARKVPLHKHPFNKAEADLLYCFVSLPPAFALSRRRLVKITVLSNHIPLGTLSVPTSHATDSIRNALKKL